MSVRYYEKHREECLEYQRQYRRRNTEKKRAYQLAHREERRIKDREYYRTHVEERLMRNKKWRWNLKMEVLSHYSNGKPRCLHCGEADPIVLCVDHINNDGAKHRKEVGEGSTIYRWLKQNNYPEGFQVLCHNCNIRKKHIHLKCYYPEGEDSAQW